MMLDCDTTVTGYNKFQLLVVEWVRRRMTPRDGLEKNNTNTNNEGERRMHNN